jgi:hypothetical protein
MAILKVTFTEIHTREVEIDLPGFTPGPLQDGRVADSDQVEIWEAIHDGDSSSIEVDVQDEDIVKVEVLDARDHQVAAADMPPAPRHEPDF